MAVVRRGNSDLLGARVPHMWFAHMLTSAEMLFMVYTGVEAFSTQSQWFAPTLPLRTLANHGASAVALVK